MRKYGVVSGFALLIIILVSTIVCASGPTDDEESQFLYEMRHSQWLAGFTHHVTAGEVRAQLGADAIPESVHDDTRVIPNNFYPHQHHMELGCKDCPQDVIEWSKDYTHTGAPISADTGFFGTGGEGLSAEEAPGWVAIDDLSHLKEYEWCASHDTLCTIRNVATIPIIPAMVQQGSAETVTSTTATATGLEEISAGGWTAAITASILDVALVGFGGEIIKGTQMLGTGAYRWGARTLGMSDELIRVAASQGDDVIGGLGRVSMTGGKKSFGLAGQELVQVSLSEGLAPALSTYIGQPLIEIIVDGGIEAVKKTGAAIAPLVALGVSAEARADLISALSTGIGYEIGESTAAIVQVFSEQEAMGLMGAAGAGGGVIISTEESIAEGAVVYEDAEGNRYSLQLPPPDEIPSQPPHVSSPPAPPEGYQLTAATDIELDQQTSDQLSDLAAEFGMGIDQVHVLHDQSGVQGAYIGDADYGVCVQG